MIFLFSLSLSQFSVSFPLFQSFLLSLCTLRHMPPVFPARIALTSQSRSFITVYLAGGLDTLFCPAPFSSPCPPCRRTDGIFLCGTVEQKLPSWSPWTRVKSAPSVKVTISARVANRLPSQTVSRLGLSVRVYACMCEVGDSGRLCQ